MSPSAIAESHINFLECSQERSLYKELEVGQDLKISYIKHEEFMVLKTEKGSEPFIIWVLIPNMDITDKYMSNVIGQTPKVTV